MTICLLPYVFFFYHVMVATYDKDGDYSVFAQLLQADGLSGVQARHLEQAAVRPLPIVGEPAP